MILFFFNFIFPLLLLALLLAMMLIFLLRLVVRGGQGRNSAGQTLNQDEEQAFRELWVRLDKLEQRLGNLETILTADQPEFRATSAERK